LNAEAAASEIRTARLILRRIVLDDVDAYARLYAEPEVVRYLGDGTVSTASETVEWVGRAIRRNELEGFDMRSVLLAEDLTFIGRCGIAVWDIEGRVEHEVGYVLSRGRWGKGYATEAATAFRNRALGELGLTRLIALIAHGNEASKKVARKLGMAYERDAEFQDRVVEPHALEG